MATSADKFSSGYKGKKRKPKPSPPSHSGGNSGDLSIPHKTRTPVDTTPYVPTEAPTAVQQGIRREQKQARIKARVNKALAESDLTSSGIDPSDILNAAGTALGLNKPSSLRPGGDTARHVVEDEIDSLASEAKKAAKKAYGPVGGQKSYEAPTKGEGGLAATAISAAPLAEGVGAGERALQKAATEASNASSGAKAGERIVARVKGAPKAAAKSAREYPAKKVAQVKAVPKKVKAAPRAAKDAATTPEGRKAAAKGAGKAAAKHPVRSGYLGAVALPEGVLPGDITKRARAFAEGSASAVANHPWETFETTARALPAAITGPVALGAAAVDSATHGTLQPLEDTAKEQAEGVGQIVGTAFSGDPKKAELAARKEGSLSLLTPIPALSRTPIGRVARDELRDVSSGARRVLATTDKLPAKDWRQKKVRHAPKGHDENATALSERHFIRKRTAEAWQRIHNKQSVPADRHAGKILEDLAKAPKGAHIALQTLAEYGIRDEKGAELIRRQGPGDAQLLAALDYAKLHPDIFKDKAFLDALKHSEEAVAGHPAAHAQVGERARVLPQGDALGITRPEHMVPHHRREELGAESWHEAVHRLKALKKKQLKMLKEAEKGTTRPYADSERVAAARVIARRERKAERVAKGKAGRAARRQAKTTDYKATPEAMASRDWYHGSPNASLSLEGLDSYGTSPTNLFGQGVYLTSKPNVARDYSKLNKGARHNPTVYKAKIDPKGVLDLEAKADPRFTQILEQTVDNLGQWKDEPLGAEFRSHLESSAKASKPGYELKNKNVYRAYETTLARFAEDYGIPASELTEVQAQLTAHLREAGIDVLTHKGGKGMGGVGEHQVAIVLDPADMGIHGKPNPVSSFANRAYPPVHGPHLQPLSKVPESKVLPPNRFARAAVEADLELTQNLLKEAKKGAKKKANIRAKKRIVTLEDGTKRKVSVKELPYGDKELKEYVDGVEAARKEAGLEKAIWTHHAKADSEKGVDLNLSPTAAKKEYAREGRNAAENNLDRSLEGFIRGTIQRPRYNTASKEFLSHIAETESIKGLKLNGEDFTVGKGSSDWKKLTARKTKDNPDGGQIDPKSMTRFPLRQWENAVDDPFKSEAQRNVELEGILKQARADRINGAEPWIPLRREALKEAEGQIHSNHNEFVKFINAGNRVASRTLLATNPAWLIAQTVAEAVPAIVAHPSLLSPAELPRLLRQMYKDRKENPEQAMAVQASAGAAPTNGRYLNTPIDEEGVMNPETWSKGAEAMTRGKSLKAALGFAKLRTLPELDIHRQNVYRELVYRAQRDKKFRKWHSGLTGLFDGAAEISKKFKGKSDHELQEWLLSQDPEAKRWNAKLTQHVDDVAGNWGAFTRFEKSAAPFLIFYPFLRYSLRWALWAFPKSHPVRATVLALMGQANSNQLEELIGHPLENPAQYAEPIFTNSEGEHETLPGGTRISPGQSSITQSVASNNPAALAQSLNPAIGVAAKGVFGVDTFTGDKTRESRGEAMVNELLSLPAPLRLAGVEVGPGPSPASKAFAQHNQNKELRSFGFPFLGQSEKEFKGEQRLSKAFGDKYSNPIPSLPPEVWEAAYNGDWVLAKKLHDERVTAEKGGDIVKKEEEPFFEDTGGELSKKGSEILKYITGTIQIPVETPKEKRKKEQEKNPFGIQGADTDKLYEEFGIPKTSASELEKQFGIK